jgi:hypothetical protein
MLENNQTSFGPTLPPARSPLVFSQCFFYPPLPEFPTVRFEIRNVQYGPSTVHYGHLKVQFSFSAFNIHILCVVVDLEPQEICFVAIV